MAEGTPAEIGTRFRAACMAARDALPRRMHHRRTHSVGADAHIGPHGIDIKSTIAERIPPLRLRGQAPLCKGSWLAKRD